MNQCLYYDWSLCSCDLLLGFNGDDCYGMFKKCVISNNQTAKTAALNYLDNKVKEIALTKNSREFSVNPIFRNAVLTEESEIDKIKENFRIK